MESVGDSVRPFAARGLAKIQIQIGGRVSGFVGHSPAAGVFAVVRVRAGRGEQLDSGAEKIDAEDIDKFVVSAFRDEDDSVLARRRRRLRHDDRKRRIRQSERDCAARVMEATLPARAGVVDRAARGDSRGLLGARIQSRVMTAEAGVQHKRDIVAVVVLRRDAVYENRARSGERDILERFQIENRLFAAGCRIDIAVGKRRRRIRPLHHETRQNGVSDQGRGDIVVVVIARPNMGFLNQQAADFQIRLIQSVRIVGLPIVSALAPSVVGGGRPLF